MVEEKVCPRRGNFLVMNRQERLGFFLQTRRNKRLLCNDCSDCYNCKRFEFIREEMDKNAFFTRDIGPKKEPWPKQPILWQVFVNEDFKKNEFNFKIYIHKKFLSDFLIKKFDFEKNQIIEVFVDKFFYYFRRF